MPSRPSTPERASRNEVAAMVAAQVLFAHPEIALELYRVLRGELKAFDRNTLSLFIPPGDLERLWPV